MDLRQEFWRTRPSPEPFSAWSAFRSTEGSKASVAVPSGGGGLGEQTGRMLSTTGLGIFGRKMHSQMTSQRIFDIRRDVYKYYPFRGARKFKTLFHPRSLCSMLLLPPLLPASPAWLTLEDHKIAWHPPLDYKKLSYGKARILDLKKVKKSQLEKSKSKKKSN